MATIGNLIVNIGAKIDGLRKGLTDSTGLIQGAKSKFQSLGGMIGTGLKTAAVVGAGALLSVGVGAVGLGTQLVGLGSDAEEMMGKFNVVFAQSGDRVTDSLAEFGAEVGRNKFELMGYAATLGDTLKPMGFTESAAADLSVELVKLATDLGSFNNMSTDEALQRLQGTLIGSHENALAFGVVINENTLKAEMAANGWDKLTGAALEQAKVQARINLLMKGTIDAQGDAARTSGSWANQMRALQATLTQTGTEIGLKLMPVVTPFLAKVGTLAREYLPLAADWFSRVIEKLIFLGDVVQNGGISRLFVVFEDGHGYIGAFLEVLGLSESAADSLGNAIANVGAIILDWITGTGLPALQQFGNWFINEGWPAVQQFAGQVMSQLIPGLMLLWTWGSQIAAVALPLLGAALQFVINHFNIIGPILAVVAGLILALSSPVTAIIAAVVLLATAWANNWFGIRDKTAAAIEFLKPYWNQLTTLFDKFIAILLPELQKVWQALVTVWQAEVGPALSELWDSLQELFTALGFGKSKTDVWAVAMGALKLVMIGVLLGVKGLTPVIHLIAGAIKVAVDKVRTFVEMLTSMKRAADAVAGPLRSMADRIKGIINQAAQLPSWLIPHSPTPFEMGLRGIGAAIKAMPEMPPLNPPLWGGGFVAAAKGLGQAATASSGGQGGDLILNFTYSPLISTGDRYEAEQILAPMIVNAVRSKFGIAPK